MLYIIRGTMNDIVGALKKLKNHILLIKPSAQKTEELHEYGDIHILTSGKL